ncbi:MAG: anaerobic ribonucleoside-triphosphate reductase activating protein [Candidatus Bathyarchaeota archaeon]|nr:MAG: anaerobic ribonucleoside-triphosphate reductase activating protein [Candidatus Bathyarchaeota archaeon]
MELRGFIDLSLSDWDGKLCSVIFLPGCNLRCPFCYNSTLVLHPETVETVPFLAVEDYLGKQRSWIDGVCITGGEPMIHKDLPELCSKLKETGFLVKVDTNGTYPKMVKTLMENGLVDYIALDIKAPLTVEKYSKATGANVEKLLEKVDESIKMLLGSNMDYEFRTTVVPTLHEEQDLREICDSVKGCKKYVLQKFDVSFGKKTMDPDFGKLKSFSDEKMKNFLAIAQALLPNVRLRSSF